MTDREILEAAIDLLDGFGTSTVAEDVRGAMRLMEDADWIALGVECPVCSGPHEEEDCTHGTAPSLFAEEVST